MDKTTPSTVSGRTHRGVIGSLAVVIAVLMASLVLAPAASAAERGVEYITSAQVSRAVGYDKDRPLHVGEKVTFGFSWDASKYYGTDKAPAAGDTMTVTLPHWARFNAASVDMTGTDGTVWATCDQGGQVVTCTFTEAVTGKQDLKGGFNSTMSLVETKKIDSIAIPVGPTEVSLRDIASQGVIDKGIVPAPVEPKDLNLTARKEGAVEGVTESSKGFVQVAWIFYVRGTGADITITDTFTNGQTRADYLDGIPGFNQSVDLRSRDIAAEQGVGGNWALKDNRPRPGTATRVPASDYTVVWRSGNDVTVTIPNSDAGKAYRVKVYTKVATNAWQNGDNIANTGHINDDQVSRKITARQMTSAYGEGRDGYGSVYVYKNVTGLGPIPDGYSAVIHASIDKPNEATTEQILKVRPGSSPENAGKLTDLPTGTKVTLREVTPTEVPGYIFQRVTFGEGKTGETVLKDDVKVAADGSAVTVTVRNAGVTEIGATNTYTPLGRLSLSKEIFGRTGNQAQPQTTASTTTASATTASATSAAETTSQQPVTASAQLPEFDVEATWLNEEGQSVTKTYTIAEGRITMMDPLPIGTEVTLKEILPAAGWAIPEYYSKNKDLELTDNRDGTATVTVPKDSFKDPVNVVVKNKPNNPGGWFPFLPGSPNTSAVNTSPVTPTPNLPGTAGAVGARPSSAPGSTTPPVSGRGVLANTGVDSVGFISVVALILLTLGGMLLMKRRQGEYDGI